MNNKIVVIGILVLLVVGGVLLYTTKPTEEKPTVTSSPTAMPSPSTEPAPQEITIIEVTDTGYKPQTLNASVGVRINWVNKSSKKVTVHSADHPTHLVHPLLNKGEFAPGEAVQVVFDKAGTYKYHNHYDPDMTGTVIVK